MLKYDNLETTKTKVNNQMAGLGQKVRVKDVIIVEGKLTVFTSPIEIDEVSISKPTASIYKELKDTRHIFLHQVEVDALSSIIENNTIITNDLLTLASEDAIVYDIVNSIIIEGIIFNKEVRILPAKILFKCSAPIVRIK